MSFPRRQDYYFKALLETRQGAGTGPQKPLADAEDIPGQVAQIRACIRRLAGAGLRCVGREQLEEIQQAAEQRKTSWTSSAASAETVWIPSTAPGSSDSETTAGTYHREDAASAASSRLSLSADSLLFGCRQAILGVQMLFFQQGRCQMDDYEAILRRVPLFAGIRPDEWERMLGCLGAVHRRYPAGEFILMAGRPPTGSASCWRGARGSCGRSFPAPAPSSQPLRGGPLRGGVCLRVGRRADAPGQCACNVGLPRPADRLPENHHRLSRRPAIFTRGWSGTCWLWLRTKTCSSTAG